MRGFWLLPSLLLLLSSGSLAQIIGGSCSDGDTCAPHGKCMDEEAANGYWCRCDNGYGGEYCEKECSLQCDDDEKCGFDAFGKNPRCICKDCDPNGKKICPKGFGGPNCANKLTSEENPCLNEPCGNGKCFPFSGGFQCICNDGFGGSYCEIGKDHCVNHNCKTGSQCVNNVNGYICACPPGRGGAFCEITNCTLMGEGICNHGKCIDTFSADKSFECQCDEGYEGEFCTKDKNECLQGDMCGAHGTCYNLAGSFVCACKPGFTGTNCQHPVNMCESYGCKNGGSCDHLPDQTPVCSCPPGFMGQKCEKACPPGKGGYNCSLLLDRPHCSRTNGMCYNGGVCNGGFCKCPPSFTGDRCELNRTAVLPMEVSCDHNPCMNDGKCVDYGDGYACICPPGFYGLNCDRRLRCATTTCANGGFCRMDNNTMTCACPLGYSGDYCEIMERLDCKQNPCKNGGVCNGTDGTCECMYGYTGTRCQEKVEIDKSKEIMFRELCKKKNCKALAGNGICDEDCNYAECQFDGGDCSGGQQPFSRCMYPAKCARSFADGICNPECNNEKCLYDGMDCQSELYHCPEYIRDYCIKKRGNGECDYACSFVGCGFDGGDCNNGTGAMILNDIRIVIQIDPLVFRETGGETLMEISTQLRAAVRIQKDESGPLVFKWDGESETERLKMDAEKLEQQKVLSHHIRRYRNVGIVGVVLYLEVEEICQPKSTCRFSTAQSVVNLIAAGLIKSNGRQSLGFSITEAMVAAPRRHEGPVSWSRNQILLIALVAFLALGTVVAGVVVRAGEPERSRKRRIIHAPVWMPPPMESLLCQSSLLEHSMHHVNAAKKPRVDYSDGGLYQEIYPRTLANGVIGDYAVPADIPEEILRPEHITLHVQAASSAPITEPITAESVKITDTIYRRQVLHWIAGNSNGKPEDQITSECLKCLDAGADVNARDFNEDTPLMFAVRARRVRLVSLMMKRGANPTIFNKSERSALHEATANRDVRMMTNLLRDPRMVDEIDELDRNGRTALMMTAGGFGGTEMAELLLKKGAKIDCDGSERRDTDKYHGRTALHYAALSDNTQMVDFLVTMNSNKDKQDEKGMTPMMLAAKEGNLKSVKILACRGASVTIVDGFEKTASQYAQDAFHHDVVAFLSNKNNYLPEVPQPDPRSRVCKNRESANTKGGRQTMKKVKRNGSKKTPMIQETNHLTPPHSDGSFSSPSPHYFPMNMSNASTPEFVYNPDMVQPIWYPTPQPTTYYGPPSNSSGSSTSPGHYEPPHDGSFYC
ncbi:hypothetical protein L3Y34_002145 [Caenorhabditis briggsae]|uniref:Notch-like transmembrane receptor n=2 Tax=Caenorhabditis briggsae TaxID=6238 RepID=Q9GPN0_CAEBR|nr:notch-like transmembrane receptor [Caenorhabditis briggsae]ULU02368.1 hypothetical protein L3Y34_002145 [Caenorhabditis briggsae]